MTPEQASKLRKGDRILVEMVVSGDNFAPRVAAHLSSLSPVGALFVDPTDIHSILPRPLEAGDRVEWHLAPNKTVLAEGQIIAVHGGEAWVCWATAGYPPPDSLRPDRVMLLSDLQRVEDQ